MEQNIRFHASGEETVQVMTAALARRGYQLVRSFDMQSALARHPVHCACPHHGTVECMCQYIVALAYPPVSVESAPPPHVITAHSYENTTLVAIQSEHGVNAQDRLGVVAAVMEAAGELLADRCADEQEQRQAGSVPSNAC